MVRYYGLSRYQRITRRRLDVGAYGRDANDFRTLTDTCFYQEAGVSLLKFENLAELSFEALSRQSSRLGQQIREWSSLKRKNTELCENFLLTNAKF